MMTDNQEALGETIDGLDSLVHALSLPIADVIHVQQLRKQLPEIVQSLKDCFVAVVGENPWEI